MSNILPTLRRGVFAAALCAPLSAADAQGYGQSYAPPPAAYAPPSGGQRPIDQSPRDVLPLYRPGIWEGLYLGAHLGSDLGSLSGATGGAHAGHNWQRDNLVFGIELDASAKSLHASRDAAGPIHADAAQDWLTSLRVRLGYGSGNALFYGTGGFAVGNLALDVNDRGRLYSSNEIIHGYVVGLGVELKFSANLSGRMEALHYGFADKTTNFPTAYVRTEADVTTLRAGLTYHFN